MMSPHEQPEDPGPAYTGHSGGDIRPANNIPARHDAAEHAPCVRRYHADGRRYPRIRKYSRHNGIRSRSARSRWRARRCSSHIRNAGSPQRTHARREEETRTKAGQQASTFHEHHAAVLSYEARLPAEPGFQRSLDTRPPLCGHMKWRFAHSPKRHFMKLSRIRPIEFPKRYRAAARRSPFRAR